MGWGKWAGELVVARGELESHFSVFAEDKEGVEGFAAFFGDELIQQVCFALGEEFFHLLGWDFSLEDDFAGAEAARVFVFLGMFADVVGFGVVNAAVAEGAFT